MIKGLLLGVLATVGFGAVLAYAAIVTGSIPANADANPSPAEKWAARTSLHATLAREAASLSNPLAATDSNLISGIKLYAANCAVCHGTADAQPSRIARGLYQHPPQFAKDGVEDDPAGKIAWQIDHGIRLTGMPAFGHNLDDQQRWQITLFLVHMDKLPPSVEKAWKSVRQPQPR